MIRIAQGNYLGTMDRGWIQIKGKYISLEGGWNDDFTERNPVRYITRIQPSVAQRGTIGQGLLMIESLTNKDARIIVDGIFFDLGLVHYTNMPRQTRLTNASAVRKDVRPDA